MISAFPVAAASTPSDIVDKVQAFITNAIAAASDGLTVSEFSELTVALLRVSMEAVDSVKGSGSDKKTWVLDAVAALFDAVADKMIPIVAWPVWVLVRGSVRSLVLLAASGAVEAILPVLRGGK